MTTLGFTKSITFANGLNIRHLYELIRETTVTSKLKDICTSDDNIDLVFNTTLTSAELTIINDLVNNYSKRRGDFVNLGDITNNGVFGVYGQVVDGNGDTTYAGMYRDTAKNRFIFFENLVKEPITFLDVNISENNKLGKISAKDFDSEVFDPKYEYFPSETKSITIIDDIYCTRVRRTKFVGSCQFSIINDVLDGPCGFYAVSKSNIEKSAAIINISNLYSKTKLNSKNNKIEKTKLFIDWGGENNIEIGKTSTIYDGNYLYKSRISADNATIAIQNKTETTFSGTTYVEISTKLVGTEIVNVTSMVDDGPNALFYLSKNDQNNNPAITKLVGSNGKINNDKLQIQWLPNTGIEVRKNSNNYDGLYEVTTLVSSQFEKIYNITLTGTSFTSTVLVRNRERVSTIISISSTLVGAPSGIFIISKNIRGNASNLLCVVHSRSPTKEGIEIIWNSDQQLKLRKTGPNYDGSYTIKIYDC